MSKYPDWLLSMLDETATYEKGYLLLEHRWPGTEEPKPDQYQWLIVNSGRSDEFSTAPVELQQVLVPTRHDQLLREYVFLNRPLPGSLRRQLFLSYIDRRIVCRGLWYSTSTHSHMVERPFATLFRLVENYLQLINEPHDVAGTINLMAMLCFNSCTAEPHE